MMIEVLSSRSWLAVGRMSRPWAEMDTFLHFEDRSMVDVVDIDSVEGILKLKAECLKFVFNGDLSLNG